MPTCRLALPQCFFSTMLCSCLRSLSISALASFVSFAGIVGTILSMPIDRVLLKCWEGVSQIYKLTAAEGFLCDVLPLDFETGMDSEVCLVSIVV